MNTVVSWEDILAHVKLYEDLKQEHYEDDTSCSFYEDLEKKGVREFFLELQDPTRLGIRECVGNETVAITVPNIEDELMLWFNVYEISRRYGGSEEGGWCFDTAYCQYSGVFLPSGRNNVWEELLQEKRLKWDRRFVSSGNLSSVLPSEIWDIRIEFLQAQSCSSKLSRPVYC